MAEKLNLPRSSFEEVVKIIKGYSHAGSGASLEGLSKLTGMNKTIISRNNKFLTDIFLIQGGNNKSATELGLKLGRALEHNQTEDAKKCWEKAISSNEGIAGLLTTVRIRGGMKSEDLSAHILYVSGQNNNKGNRTGANTIVDMLLTSRLLEEVDGILTIATPKEEEPTLEKKLEKEDTPDHNKSIQSESHKQSPTIQIPALATTPQIAINIQLHLPETDNAEVYEKLFKALKDNLLTHKE